MSAHLPVLLASSDTQLVGRLQGSLGCLDQRVQVVMAAEQALVSMQASAQDAENPAGLLLLDVNLPGVTDGHLLAVIQELGLRRRWAVALIAERVSDEWIARLREGMIDDIIPRQADAETWKTHLTNMRRGHALLCEVEELREARLMEIQLDAVTGTLNRDTLLTILFRETDRVQRAQGMLSVVVFDVDGFGRLNEELGWDSGDQILREVARRSGRMLRTYDALGRLGRDEFLLSLPGCSAINATMLAERLRIEVFGEPFWVKKSNKEIVELRLSACFGITVSRGRSPVVVVREAEQAVALARQAGPNQMRCATDSAESMIGRQLFPEFQVVAG